MLARLELIEGVPHAEVDYGGKHMRLTFEAPSGLDAATTVLRDLGYQPEVVAQVGEATGKWYDVSSIYELSAVEADVIAHRVVGKFSRETVLAPGIAERLERAVSAALQACFTNRDANPDARPREFQNDCVERASEAAGTVLNAKNITAFIATLKLDLNEDHTRDAGL